MARSETPNPKAVIKRVDEYEIHLAGDNEYRSAKTKEEAEKVARGMEAEAKAYYEEYHSAAAKAKQQNQLALSSYEKYADMLRQMLYHVARQKPRNEEIVSFLKETIHDLDGIGKHKLCVKRNLGGSELYLDTIKED